MIKIACNSKKIQKNFWNNCVFHPTDAIEDPWGRRILDQISADKAIKTIRIYTMFEDIVYLDENGKLCFDFRLSDLRLDYLTQKGYDVLLSYAGIPDCIASGKEQTSVSKNKTRYKGKMWNASPPSDYALWEEICYQYTLHNVNRYGIKTVSRWRCQCFNEPDIPWFFFASLSEEEGVLERVEAYTKMYEGFARAIKRVSEKISVGGPALAFVDDFLKLFLQNVKDKSLPLDFISLHDYGTKPEWLNDGSRPFCATDIVENISAHFDVIRACGFGHLPVLIDEWGMSNAGFYNKEECPSLLARENEIFSAYFVKLIREFLNSGIKVEMLAVCLSGQHEMTEDFSGFRNFFTLNFIKKPIYNAFILASCLGETLLKHEQTDKNVAIIPTKTENGGYAVMLSYSEKNFDEDLTGTTETLVFDDEIIGKTATVWCIDKQNNNPYRLYLSKNIKEPTKEDLELLRAEGNLKPLESFTCTQNSIDLNLTANCTYFIEIK